jgi:hypothetical protein
VDEGVGEDLPRRQWRVLAHVCRQRLHDWPVFALAFLGDALERVYAAEAGSSLSLPSCSTALAKLSMIRRSRSAIVCASCRSAAVRLV